MKHAFNFIHPPEGCIFQMFVTLVGQNEVNHGCHHRVGVLVFMAFRVNKLQRLYLMKKVA